MNYNEVFQVLHRRSVVPATLLAGVALAVLPSGASAASCAVPTFKGSGYFTSLVVTGGASCATGKKVVLAHHKCRTRTSSTGRCTTKVMGYSCKEQRRTIKTEINGRVTCKKGARTVTYSYQQNV